MNKSVVATAGINIAIIKYWGKRDEKLNLPLNSSLSITLNQDHLKTTTKAKFDSSIESDKLIVNGVQENISKNKRVQNCLMLIRQLANSPTAPVLISSVNNFPTAAGLASSASGYAALVTALAALHGVTDRDCLTTVARRGSGSATRSMHGGFVKWHRGEKEDGGDSCAEALGHLQWPDLRVFIVVACGERKSVGSTEGMRRSVETSELLRHRAEVVVPRRIKELEDAIETKNFPEFARIAMAESNQLHAICADSYPTIRYLNETSERLKRMVLRINRDHGREICAYSFDAGPNCFLFCLEENSSKLSATVRRYFPAKPDCDQYFRGIPQDTKADCFDLKGDFPVSEDAVEYVICSDVGGGPDVKITEC